VQIKTNEGLGSGVVYDKSGLLMTNAHVVGSSSQVQVQTSDGSTVTGQVVGSDTATDIAVVKIDPKAVKGVAVLALDENIRVGQLAVAIGSPFGLDHTVTAGIVSAVGRPFDESAQTGATGQTGSSGVVVPMIQTDAPINPGNSGGALADRKGQVIGINTAIYSQTGDNSGVGFAIPIALAYSRAEKLAKGEQVATPFLGIGGDSPADGSAGALVTTVESGSAAQKAGLRQGDIVVAMDGKPVASFLDLAASIGAHAPGDSVKLEVVRDGKHIQLTATLGSR
jgi:S1-C subfamily serine protease